MAGIITGDAEIRYDRLAIIPLGGQSELGQVLWVFCWGGDLLLVDAGAGYPEDDMPGVDLLLPNTDELRALGGAAAVLRHVVAVAVSAGADGASWADPTGRCHAVAPPATVVDATGAGDAFDAGVLVARLSGASPAEALAGSTV